MGSLELVVRGGGCGDCSAYQLGRVKASILFGSIFVVTSWGVCCGSATVCACPNTATLSERARRTCVHARAVA